MVVGFGFVLEKSDFNVVQMLYDRDTDWHSWCIGLLYGVKFTGGRLKPFRHVDVLYASSSIVYVISAVHWIGYKRLGFGHFCCSICLLIWVAMFSKRWYCPVMVIRVMVMTDCACLLWLLVRQSLFFKLNNQWKYGWCRIMALWMSLSTILVELFSVPVNFMEWGCFSCNGDWKSGFLLCW